MCEPRASGGQEAAQVQVQDIGSSHVGRKHIALPRWAETEDRNEAIADFNHRELLLCLLDYRFGAMQPPTEEVEDKEEDISTAYDAERHTISGGIGCEAVPRGSFCAAFGSHQASCRFPGPRREPESIYYTHELPGRV